MKKIALLFLSLVLTVSMLGSCSFDFLKPNTDEKEKEKVDNLIYNGSTTLYLVYDPEKLSEDQIGKILNAFSEKNIYVETHGNNPTVKEHELIIGNPGREEAEAAYIQLDRVDKNSESDLRFCFYSTGSSLILAYDEDAGGFCLDVALEYLIDNYVSEQLVLKKGTAHKEAFDIYEYLAEADAAEFDRYWNAVNDALGSEGQEVLAALQALYTIYDGEGLVSWVANLYDPDICVCKGYYGEETCSNTQWCHTGGFYFSNSGRDTVGFLPDVESTLQALNLIGSCGITKGLGGSYDKIIPEWMADQIVDFVLNLQDPDGYFYHPQWGKNISSSRRGRDLTWSMNILKKYKVSPKYDTIYDASNDESLATSAKLSSPLGASKVVAVSRVVATESETLIPDHLKTPEAFRDFLNAQDIRNNSYGVGSNLSAQGDQIVARGPEYGEILINWLNENQYENGTWHHTLGYDAINGVMKISGSYSRWKAEMPRAESTVRAAFASIDTEEKADGVVDVWNAWVAATKVLDNIKSYGENGVAKAAEIRASLMPYLDEAILATREKLTVFLKKDGSFVYQATGFTSGVSMGQPVAVKGTDEGDLNATLIASCNTISYIFQFMEMSSLAVPIALSKERMLFLDIIENLPPVNKDSEMTDIPDPFDFDSDEVGETPADVYNGSAGGDMTLLVAKDPRGDGNVAHLQSSAGKSDSITVNASGPIKNVTGMVYETEMCINSASQKDGVFRLEFGQAGDSKNIYRISFKTSSSSIEMYDCSANDAKKRVTNHLADLEYGQWFKLRVEVYTGDHDSFRAKVFLDGKLLAISDNYYDNTGNKLLGTGVPNTAISVANLYVLNGEDLDVMVDNLSCYKNTAQYTYEPLHEDYRYAPGALNVDNYSENGIIYGMDDCEVGGSFPREISVTGDAKIASDGDNNYVLFADGASLAAPYVKRARIVNHSSVALDVRVSDYTVGEGIKIGFKESNADGGELFNLTLKAVLEDGATVFRLFDKDGNAIDGVNCPSDKNFNIRISHYESVGMALIYVDEQRVGFYKITAPLIFGRAAFTAIGEVSADNLVIERDYREFTDATAPKEESKLYEFDKDTEDIIVSGNGASVSSSKLTLKGGASKTEIKIPVFMRDSVASFTEFGFEISFSGIPTNGTTHTVALADESGNEIIAFTLKSVKGTVSLYETSANKTYENALLSFSSTSPTSLSFEYYESEKLCKVFRDGEHVFTTAIVYSEDSASKTPAFVKIKTGGIMTSLLDSIYADRYYKFYEKNSIPAIGSEGEVITFEGNGGSDLPSNLVAGITSNAPDVTVVEAVKDGEAGKVIKYETKPGVRQDTLKIMPTGSISGATSYVFEADVMVLDGTAGTVFQLDYCSGGKKSVEINIVVSGSKITFSHKDHLTGKTAKVDIASKGEWFNLRAEYYTVFEDGVIRPRLKVFVNDELKYVTDIQLIDAVFTTVDYMSLNSLIAAEATIYLDNVSFTGSTSSYDGTPITEGFVAGKAE